MKKEFRGFGKIFSFTFLHHVKSKGYIASTLIIAMLCLLIPVGVLAGSELIGGGEAEPEQGMKQETETTMELETGEEIDQGKEFEKLQYLYVVDRSQDGLEELAGFGDYLRQEAGLDLQVRYFENDMDKAAELSSGRRDVMVLTADQVGKDFELNLLVPEGGVSEMAAESLVPLLDQYIESAKSRLNGTSGAEDGAAEEDIGGTDAAEDGSSDIDVMKEIVAMIFTFLNIMVLYFFVLIYGQSVAGSVVMEKNSKLMEVFLTAVKPSAMIMGKLLAISLSGMLQLVSWVVSLFAGFALGGGLAQLINPDAGNPLAEVMELAAELTDGMFSAATLIAALVMALLGVILYCSLAAIGGALAGKQEDLSSTNVAFTLVLIISFFAALYGGGIEGFGADAGLLKTLLDWIPFTAVMVTPSKILLGMIPLGYGLGSIALTAAVTILLVAAAGRLYKAMALYKGQVPSPKDIIKLIRAR
ncbi:MAG: ABC transporter permease [Anaerovoracaceae bacterium]